ncbi:VOC family protein [Paucilactobacillus kaifaensis]|uniref:VOC family protein n=1 Tax=Paucilactobacillus kaifaensis TaxID=2559921 RepID=UPI0010FA2F90|nr:glyoxalase/bleomycin resistance/extradiol dioxygenase family protein [Paucilactobacillus kaifaensis]
MATSSLYPYLTFTNTKEALQYYQKTFNAQDVQRLPVTTEAATAMNVPNNINLDDLTMHAVFTILGVWLYASDNFNHDEKLTNSTRLLIDIDSDDKDRFDEAMSLYEQLENDASVNILMPLAEQNWGTKLAMLQDKYGITWMLQIRSFSASQN